MTSSKEYLEYILEQLRDLDEVTYRPMMGEYLLYYQGRNFGGIYDNRLLVKPVPSAAGMMPGSKREVPYEGAKEMILVSETDERDFLCALVKDMYDELPLPKKRK